MCIIILLISGYGFYNRNYKGKINRYKDLNTECSWCSYLVLHFHIWRSYLFMYRKPISRLWKHTEFRTYSFFVPVWPYSVSDRNCNPLIRYMGTSTEIQFSTLLSRINTKLPTPQNCDFHLIIFCMSIISGCLAYSEF